MSESLGQTYQKASTQVAWPDNFKDRMRRVADMLKSHGYNAEVSDLYGDPKRDVNLHVSSSGVHMHATLSPGKTHTLGTFFGDLLQDAVGGELTQGKDTAYILIHEVDSRRQMYLKSENRIDTPKQAQRLAREITQFMQSQAPTPRSENKPSLS
jgi:DNA-directed RNA polymerase subunit L